MVEGRETAGSGNELLFYSSNKSPIIIDLERDNTLIVIFQVIPSNLIYRRTCNKAKS